MTATAPAEKQVSATLIAPREEAIKFLNTLLERGEELKVTRIRNGDELDEARGKKLEWMQDTTDWLNNLFDNSSVADYVNDWVGKIFPEYAEFGIARSTTRLYASWTSGFSVAMTVPSSSV